MGDRVARRLRARARRRSRTARGLAADRADTCLCCDQFDGQRRTRHRGELPVRPGTLDAATAQPGSTDATTAVAAPATAMWICLGRQHGLVRCGELRRSPASGRLDLPEPRRPDRGATTDAHGALRRNSGSAADRAGDAGSTGRRASRSHQHDGATVAMVTGGGTSTSSLPRRSATTARSTTDGLLAVCRTQGDGQMSTAAVGRQLRPRR